MYVETVPTSSQVRCWLTSLVVAFAALTAPSPADAQAPPDPKDRLVAEAERLSEEGRLAAEEGDFAKAADRYERALVTAPQWKYAWNLARVHELSGNLLAAHRYLQKSRKLATDPRQSAKTLESLGALEARLVRQEYVLLEVRVKPDGALVAIDGEPVERDDGRLRRWVRAGVHRLSVSAPGHTSIDETFTLPATGEASLERTLAVAAPVRVEPKPDPKPDPKLVPKPTPKPVAPPPRSSVVPWVAAGASAVALGTGVFLLTRGVSKAQDALDMPHANAAQKQARQDAYDSAGTTYYIGWAATGVAVVGAGVTTWLFLRSSAPDAPARTGLVIAPTLNGMVLSGRF